MRSHVLRQAQQTTQQECASADAHLRTILRTCQAADGGFLALHDAFRLFMWFLFPHYFADFVDESEIYNRKFFYCAGFRAVPLCVLVGF